MSELDQYDYQLPRELIAQEPLRSRGDARLLVVDRGPGTIEASHIRDLPSLLQSDDLLVLNDTRVIPARLVGRREATGGRWTGLYLGSDDQGLWRVLGKTRGRLRPLERILLQDRDGRPRIPLTLLAPIGEGMWAAKPEADAGALQVLGLIGRVPLPPYIRGGEMMDADTEAYQTVYANKPGAVAAPTAGLHFTPQLLQQIEGRGVETARLTLHVGIGTFRPITADRLDQHIMHQEWAELGPEAAEQIRHCRQRGGRIVAVGTTVVRALESAAAQAGFGAPWTGETDLFIRPPYTFQSVDALLTNFHLPRSTLLVLVRTFGGDALIRKAYQFAIEERFRFYSYGDAMLII